MDGEEPSFRPQEPPQYRGSSVKRPFAQLNIDDEWPSASGSSGRGSRGLVGGSDGEDSDRHKRARSESESSGDESLASFSATSSSSSQAGSSSSSSSESHESPSAGLPSSYDSVVDTVFVRDDGRNELHILDEHPDLGMRPIEDALAVSRPLIQERRIDASDQINRHEGTEPT
ncbi:hypothetical protein NEOLEDRAFT_712492 [Neolentinus lepideus HHB14362 ss-1]|uniref:Uncharacterized protein n=1 Tax=Neolentinus lepideus HHB14362 ss-1 TaxID=1314782 RepID=A0A165Q425_9AGAM|nr:hypothetical protein NEOLEDRAFT_712492 [Neolentinus lepideus HHB14362 ss-1]